MSEHSPHSHSHSHSHSHDGCGVACSHSFPGASARVNQRVEESLKNAQKKIESLNQRLEKQNGRRGNASNEDSGWADDWVGRYRQWEDWDWESAEEISEKLREEQRALERMQQRQQFTPHQHDHTIEREIFELPDEEKLRLCEKSRTLGNYLFSEGQFIRALEQYHLAVSFYEYCFPDDEAIQQRLDEIKQLCLLNAALCNLRLKRYRNAINNCDQILDEAPENMKALYRRAIAHRQLGDFELAKRDLETALRIEPSAGDIIKELQTLQLQKAAYDEAAADVGRKMFNTAASTSSAPSTQNASQLRPPGLLDSALEQGKHVAITDPIQPVVPEDAFDVLARHVDSLSQFGGFTLADFVQQPSSS